MEVVLNLTERTEELIGRAERIGVRLNYDQGLVTVSIPRTIDSEIETAMMKELEALRASVRDLLKRRAISRRAKDFVGSRVWIMESGAGSLVEVENDGQLNVRTPLQADRLSTTAYADNIFVILEALDTESASTELASTTEMPLSEKGRRRLFNLWS